MEKFKKFIENWYFEQNVSEDKWHYELLVKIWEEKFKGESILERASDFTWTFKKWDEIKVRNKIIGKISGGLSSIFIWRVWLR